MKIGKLIIGASAALCAISAYCFGFLSPDADIEVSAAEKGIAVDEANFPDINFRKYVAEKIDLNGDLLLSKDEINGTKTISVSGADITSLKGIEYFKKLGSLICTDNSLKELDITANTKLTSLYASGNMLTKIDLSHNPELENLDLGMTSKNGKVYGNKLTELDLSSNGKLKNLSCVSNSLKKLDLSGNTKLEIVKCSENRLTSLDVSGCKNLKRLECYSNDLKKVDVSGNPALEGFFCSGNKLTSLDITGNSALNTLFCRYNYISRKSSIKGLNEENLQNCDYSPQYYKDYNEYITDVNLAYKKIITGKYVKLFNISSGITGVPDKNVQDSSEGIEFVCFSGEHDYKISGSELSIDSDGRIKAKTAGVYSFTLTIKNANADGTDFVKDFTVEAVDMNDHSEHEFEWKSERGDTKGHYQQCFCGERTETKSHKYKNEIYQLNGSDGKLYNYRACKICGYAEKLGESVVFKDSETKIKFASLDDNAKPTMTFKANAADISEIGAENTIYAFEIHLVDGTSEIRSGCKAKINVPLPHNVDVSAIKLLRKKDDGSFAEVSADYNKKENSITFTSDRFGTFAVTAVRSENDEKYSEKQLDELRQALSDGNADKYLDTYDLNGDGKIDNKDLILMKSRLDKS